jgi:hypothetical protein
VIGGGFVGRLAKVIIVIQLQRRSTMRSVRTRWASYVLCTAAAAITIGGATRPVRAGGTMSQDEKMKWFREAKFGLFMPEPGKASKSRASVNGS